MNKEKKQLIEKAVKDHAANLGYDTFEFLQIKKSPYGKNEYRVFSLIANKPYCDIAFFNVTELYNKVDVMLTSYFLNQDNKDRA